MFRREELVSDTDARDLETQGSFVAILDVTLESDRAEKKCQTLCEGGGDTTIDSYHVTQVKARLAETTRGCLEKTCTSPQYGWVGRGGRGGGVDGRQS